FLLQGARTVYLHNVVAAADGSCVADPNASVKRVSRLSYNAPFCSVPQQAGFEDLMHPYEAGLETGKFLTGNQPLCVWNGKKPLPSPNPCLRTVYTKAVSGTVILVWQIENHEFEAAIGPVAPITFDPAARQITSIGGPVFGN